MSPHTLPTHTQSHDHSYTFWRFYFLSPSFLISMTEFFSGSCFGENGRLEALASKSKVDFIMFLPHGDMSQMTFIFLYPWNDGSTFWGEKEIFSTKLRPTNKCYTLPNTSISISLCIYIYTHIYENYFKILTYYLWFWNQNLNIFILFLRHFTVY